MTIEVKTVRDVYGSSGRCGPEEDVGRDEGFFVTVGKEGVARMSVKEEGASRKLEKQCRVAKQRQSTQCRSPTHSKVLTQSNPASKRANERTSERVSVPLPVQRAKSCQVDKARRRFIHPMHSFFHLFIRSCGRLTGSGAANSKTDAAVL